MIVGAITCTKGRHSLLERCLGLLLKQDYDGFLYHIIFNNSPVEQRLSGNFDSENRKVILINQSLSSETGEKYSSVGQIFRDALSYVPEDVELITFPDDDDVFLKNHISEGVKGYLKGGKLAYKPKFSYFQTQDGVSLMANVSEPSIFVNRKFLDEKGFSDHSSAFHHQWLNPLIYGKLIYEPEYGTPTFVYQWTGESFHLSGNGDNPDNLKNHDKYSRDEGDRVITPNFNYNPIV